MQASDAITLIFGTIPLATMLISYCYSNLIKPTQADLCFAVLILLFISLLLKDILQHQHSQPLQGLIFSIVLCIASALGSAYSVVCSTILMQKKFTASQILFARFWLCLLCSLLLVTSQPEHLSLVIHHLSLLTLLALGTLVIPSYLIQWGVALSDAVTCSLVLTLTPIIGFFLQLLDPRTPFSFWIFTLNLLLTATVFLSAFYKIK